MRGFQFYLSFLSAVRPTPDRLSNDHTNWPDQRTGARRRLSDYKWCTVEFNEQRQSDEAVFDLVSLGVRQHVVKDVVNAWQLKRTWVVDRSLLPAAATADLMSTLRCCR